MLAKMKIRRRLLLLALVATAALAGASGAVSDQLVGRDGAAVALDRLTEVNRAAVEVAADLQAESDVAGRYLTGAAAVEELAARREASDASLARLGDAMSGVGGSHASRLSLAADALSGVFDHRQAVDAGRAGADELDAFATSVRLGLVQLQEASGVLAVEEAGAGSLTVAGLDLNLVIGAAGGLLVLALALAVSRSITRPLRAVTAAAERGARLPALVEALRRPTGQDRHLALAPVGLAPHGEIGRAAAAFDAFQGAAAKLAVSHAGMLNRSVAEKGTAEVFVNLARRMQSLVDHQIEFLDGLEAGEEDPDSLEDLFRLDQLATRVRRNAESLLSLAGSAAVRSWERPLSMADVIRAGAAEVEDLSRIDVSVKDHFTMLGNVAADAAHLLSELLENAARWSPPGTRVQVAGRPAPGGYEILVQDHGVGMSPQALAEANHVLTGPPVAGPTVARSLGLVVAGRLARRLGIEVRLASAAPSGVTARVFVPSTLIVSTEEEAAGVEDPAGGRALPFALARQEKRARISSQRRRGPRGARPAPGMAPAPAPPGLPTVEDRSATVIPLGDPPRRTDEPGPAAPPRRAAAPGGEDLRMPEVPPQRVSWSPAPPAPPPAPAPALEPPPPPPPAGHRSPPGPEPPPAAGPTAPAPGPAARADQYQELLDRAAAAGLVRRVPKASLPADTGAANPRVAPAPPPGQGNGAPRVPDDVRNLLSTYRSGVSRGRTEVPPGARPPSPPRPAPAPPAAPPPLEAHVRPEAPPAPAGHPADRETAGLVRRVPRASLPPDTGPPPPAPAAAGDDRPGAGHRLPEDVRNLLSNYRSGVRRGRVDEALDDQAPPSPDQPPPDPPQPSPQEWS